MAQRVRNARATRRKGGSGAGGLGDATQRLLARGLPLPDALGQELLPPMGMMGMPEEVAHSTKGSQTPMRRTRYGAPYHFTIGR